MVHVLAVADEVVDALTFGVGVQRRPDIILGAGDLPYSYLEVLTGLFDAPCVFVPGNHDTDLRGYRRGRTGWTHAGLPANDPGPGGAINADCRTVQVAGLTISGIGGCRRYNSGANQYTESQQRLRSWQLTCRRPRPDILLTHSPARGVGDADDPPHRGFDCYHHLVRRLSPTLLVHGHVHPYGTRPEDKIIGEDTISMNVVGYCEFDITPRSVTRASIATHGGVEQREFAIVRRRHGA